MIGPSDWTALRELREWCLKNAVTKVTVNGITLELGEAAFWEWEMSKAPGGEKSESPPNAPWDMTPDDETPQQRIRRMYVTGEYRESNGDKVD